MAFYLSGCVSKRIGVAACRRTVHITRVAKEVRSSPQQLDPRPLLFFFENLHNRVEVLVRFSQRLSLGRDISIMKAIERGTELFKKLKSHPCPIAGVLNRVGCRFPRAVHRPRPEGIAAGPAKSVPIGDRETQMLLHRLAFDEFTFVVMAKGERAFGLRTFKANFADFRKGGHGQLSRDSNRPGKRVSFANSRHADKWPVVVK